MQSKQVVVLTLLVAMAANCQRPSFAGTKPIGYPELYDLTTKADELGNRFGEGDANTTTQRLPLEANGDKNLIDRLSKLPIDNQPFWFINWQALEEHRKNPQTYPQKPNSFIPIASNSNIGTQSSTPPIQNQNTVTSSTGIPLNSRISDSASRQTNNFGTTEAVFGYADSEIGRIENSQNTKNANTGGITLSSRINNGITGIGGNQQSGTIATSNVYPGYSNYADGNSATPKTENTPNTNNNNNPIIQSVGKPKVNNIVYNSMVNLHKEEPGKHGLSSNRSFSNTNLNFTAQRTDNPNKSWTNDWKYAWTNSNGYENHYTIKPQPITQNAG